MPYINLKTELMKSNITNEETASALKLQAEDTEDKLSGSGRFTIEEAMCLKTAYFPHLPLEYLFVHMKSQP